MNTLFKILFVTRLPIFFAVILYLTIFAPSLLADNNLSSRTKTVVVSPVSFSYDDTITITVHGLPVDYTLPPDSVYLGDTLVRIPGHSGDLDARPTSDLNGTLSFSTTLPDNLQIGSQYLAVNITNIFEAQTAVTVRPISLRVSSTTVVPYQDVWVMGRGFKARPGSNVLTYTIDENEPGGVTIKDQRVLTPYVVFPIKLGSDGSSFFKLTIPELSSTLTPGKVELRVTDSSGRIGTAELTVPNSILSTVPTSAYPGQSLTFSLIGLPASNLKLNVVNRVNVEYRYSLDSSGNRFASTLIGRYTTDGTGKISGFFDVPKPARLSSTNYIDVRPSYGDGRSLSHQIAGRTIAIEPAIGFPGHNVLITFKGMPANYKLDPNSVLMGGKQITISDNADQLVSDDIGQLTLNAVVPSGIPNGLNVVVWEAPATTKVKTTFTVKEGTLNFDTTAAVPGQLLKVTSGGFSGTFVGEGSKQSAIRITGSGDSWVWMDGVKLRDDQIVYPILVDKNDPFEFVMRIPVDAVTAAKSSLEFLSVDTAGRSSRGTLTLQAAMIAITPSQASRKADVTVNGTGFAANTNLKDKVYKVLIDYAGIPVGSARLDSEGAFSYTFSVPPSVSVNTTHRVTGKLKAVPSFKAHATHTVPESYVQASSTSALPGSEIKITGTGLSVYSQVTIGIGHLWAAPPPIFYTDDSGAFETIVMVPEGLAPGVVDLSVYAPYPKLSKQLTFLVMAE